ncbi:MAG: tRNA pseudouridine(38-40) synthase TruA [Clostridiales bacterium]|mgnify:FL=1|nr:MAG: tRNA pseudouridine(38-40) synthase TruA [Clostridiales bacterium]
MRIGLKIEYDGTAYGGWQRQKNAPSIQQTIEEALERALGCSCRVIGAGRTDAGVHAYGQVAHLDIETKIPADRFSYILNQKLPDDIRIVQSWQAAENFHARRDAIGKHYRYTIYQAPHASALERNSSVHVPQQLDVKKMQQAAQVLIGEHDFSAFRTVGSNIVGTVRTVYRLEVQQQGQHIHIDIWGNGFLYNMVRIIAGTLIEVGKGKIPVQEMQSILDSKERARAGATAPAKGLAMCEVFYRTEEVGKL